MLSIISEHMLSKSYKSIYIKTPVVYRTSPVFKGQDVRAARSGARVGGEAALGSMFVRFYGGANCDRVHIHYSSDSVKRAAVFTDSARRIRAGRVLCLLNVNFEFGPKSNTDYDLIMGHLVNRNQIDICRSGT